MLLNAAAICILLFCVLITGTCGGILYFKYCQRKLWNEYYVLLKIKFSLIAELIAAVREIYFYETDALRVLTGCVGAFIAAKTPAEAVSADARAQAALNNLEKLLNEKYPSVRDSDGYIFIKTKIMKTDEKIGFASKFYDESVTKLNAFIKTVPFGLVAGIFNIRAKMMIKKEIK